MAKFKRESWVEGGCDVIQLRHQNKCGYFHMQKRSARFIFYHDITRRPRMQIIAGLPFGDLSNGGGVFDKFTQAIFSQE